MQTHAVLERTHHHTVLQKVGERPLHIVKSRENQGTFIVFHEDGENAPKSEILTKKQIEEKYGVSF